MGQHKIVVVGSVVADRIYRVASLPMPGESAIVEETLEASGGKGANQAAAAARLGAETHFLGCVGKDDAGQLAREALASAGVALRLVETEAAPTGHAAVLVDEGGENLIAVHLGANEHLEPAHLEAEAETLAGAQVYVTQLEVPNEVVEATRQMADAAEAISILNAAPARIEAKDVFRGFDVVVLNRLEAEMFSEVGIQAMTDVFAALRAVKDLGARSAIVTLGEAGAAILHDGETKHLSVPAVEAVDATGAGDAFVGALAVFLAKGMEFEDAALKACLYGALATTAVGARGGYGDQAALEAFEKALGVEED